MSEIATTELIRAIQLTGDALQHPVTDGNRITVAIANGLSLVLACSERLLHVSARLQDHAGVNFPAWSVAEIGSVSIDAKAEFETLSPEIVVGTCAFEFPRAELPRVQAWLAKVQA